MPIFPLLFILFLTIPVIEIYILINIGSHLGAGLTVFLVVLTAFIGAWCVRLQGLSTMQKLQQQLQQGQMPAQAMFDGFMLFVAGLLLITPGFLTDTIGFLLLVPPFRKLMLAFLLHRFAGQMQAQWHVSTARGATRPSKDPNILEGEYRKDDE